MDKLVHVFVHDVEVGSLPLEDYRKILAEVKKQKRLYFTQALEYLSGIMRCIELVINLFCMCLLAVFTILFLYIVVSANGVEVISWMQQAKPGEIVSALQVFFLLALMLSIVSMQFSRAIRLQTKDVFGAAVHTKIRQLLEVPSDGPMTVSWTEERLDDD